MRYNSDLFRLKNLFVSVIGIAISGWYTLGELNFALRGQPASGSIIAIRHEREFNRRMRRKSVQKVEFQFTDANGTQLHSQDTVPLSWKAPDDGKLPVQYIPGHPVRARIAGHTNFIPIIAFAICLGWAVFALLLVWREARKGQPQSAASTPPKRSKKQRRANPSGTD